MERPPGTGLAAPHASAAEPPASPPAAEPPPSPLAAEPPRATFAEVFAVGEFRALWLAFLLSVAGDQLARVAMTVLVYDRTRSPLLTALTYAVTFLPWIVGGVWLAGLADRLPRRQVMIACDVARMALVGAMVVVSLTGWAVALPVMVALLFVVTLFDSPFKSARSALVADILTGETYVLGTTVTQITFQVSTVVGFALGGVAVGVLGARPALAIDAATFGVSALLLLLRVRSRPAAGTAAGRSAWAQMVAGVRLVFGDRRLRTLMLFGWLVAFYVVPMGLAAPYAATVHGAPFAMTTGLVFAAVPLGTAIGSFLFGRLLGPARRQAWMGPLAVGACAVLVVCGAGVGFAVSLAVFVLAGAFASYQIAANAAFVTAIPPSRRGQAFGLANGGMQVLQGVWFIAAGAVAQATGPAMAIAISGGLGGVMALLLTARRWTHSRAARS